MRCPACGGENPSGKRFCRSCGASLLAVCAACGATLQPDDEFCGDCGTPVAKTSDRTEQPAPEPLPVRAPESARTELRHVSVLFCDLVGFTPLSESKDPEEMRELLSGYFELARAIVGRYGGVIQKFIGDAVMAVWGAPLAREDDAERAVRAGLELLAGVEAYGSEQSVALQARVGIVTGEAATTEAAEEGLVIGDRVNTASRIQSVAPPGRCFVDESTRSATSAAIAYREAGSHELKGKSEPVQVFEATRVIAAVAGSQRANVLEAPFTGRDHELRLLKELFHASAERSAARLVLVSGVAGVGKSRLAWEFFKYIDGLAGDVLWHAGRCLSYGEGVSYWALSEMVRARLQISEEDPPEVVTERLRTGLERWIPDPADREFLSPRLGQLLGLPTAQSFLREELFSGWRLFFERLSEHLPVVMVVEDLQWADAGLVDFLDHLLEWSGDHAVFLLVLTRPEGADRKGLVLSRRSLTTLPLDPLPDDVIGHLLDGLVPDLPPAARARIVERAEGIPLYAVETVRSLLDKGVLEKRPDGLLHLVGELGTLEIPPGLTALVASRLDALSPEERRVVKECSVLGESFSRQSVEAVTETDSSQLEELLAALVRKEILTVRADKLSPERGQYAFTQSLIRSVAYDMLSRAERKARHLRTAAHLRAAYPEGGAEVSEVVAAHLHDAYLASGDDSDSGELRGAAKDAYVQAGERADSVGAPEAAEAAYLRAVELSTDEAERTSLTERAATMSYNAGFPERALPGFEAAVAGHRKAGRLVEAARATAELGSMLTLLGRGEEAIVILREELDSVADGALPPAVVAMLQSRLAAALLFSGQLQAAFEPTDEALVLAQQHELTDILARALNVRGIILTNLGRVEEARLHFEGSAEVSERIGVVRSQMIAEHNLADLCTTHDRDGVEEHCQKALSAARRRGDRAGEASVISNLTYFLFLTGRIDEARRLADEVIESGVDDASWLPFPRLRLAGLEALRGNIERAREHLGHCGSFAATDDVQNRAMYAAGESAVALAEGRHRPALDAALRAIESRGTLSRSHEAVRLSVPLAIDAALALQDLEALDQLVQHFASHPSGEIPAFLRAEISRARGLLAAARGQHDGVEDLLTEAINALRDLGYPYWAAQAELDLAEWFAAEGRGAEAEAMAKEAAAIFEQLEARPMLTRAAALLTSAAAEHVATAQTSLPS